MEYPKALYHPTTKALSVVFDAEQESETLASWGEKSPAPQVSPEYSDEEPATNDPDMITEYDV